MYKKILLSLLASTALIATFALPVNAAGHHGTNHHATAKHATATHHATAQHATAKNATAKNATAQHAAVQHHDTLGHGHTIKSELEARTNAPHSQTNKVMYRVNTAKLNERTGPGTSHKKVGTLKDGTLVEIKELSHDGKWALAHTGTWVATKYLEKDSTEKHHGMTHLGEKTPEYHAHQAKRTAHGKTVTHNAKAATHAKTGTHVKTGTHAKTATHAKTRTHAKTGTHVTHGRTAAHVIGR